MMIQEAVLRKKRKYGVPIGRLWYWLLLLVVSIALNGWFDF